MSTSHRNQLFPYRKYLSRLGPTLLLVMFSFFSIYPVLLLFFTSTKPQSELVRNPFGPPWTLFGDNYKEVWTTEGLPKYLLNSIIVSGSVVLGTVVLSAFAGYGLARLRFRGKT